MRFDIITIFPEIINAYLNESIIKRARERRLLDVRVHNLRDFAYDKHKTVDDRPFGGGTGMVMKVEPIIKALDTIICGSPISAIYAEMGLPHIVVLSAKGRQFNQKMAYNWAKKYDRMVLISGRYEGIDERVKKILKAQEISIGPYVLTDGDVAALVVISAVTRLIPGVIKFESLEEESHWNLLLKKEKMFFKKKGLEYPHYTRPEVFEYKGKKYRVPRVLTSGNHKKIEAWRKKHTS